MNTTVDTTTVDTEAKQELNQLDPASQPETNGEIVGKGASEIADLLNIPAPRVKMETIPFHFKKDSTGNKRPTIQLTLPYVTFHGLVEALKDEKQQAFILDVVNAEIYKAARSQVGDDTAPVEKQEDLQLDKLTLEALANMPKAERTGGGIGKEVWEAFAKDYVEVMPAITGKNAEQVGNAAKILLAKFQPVKTNKKVIAYVKQQLNLWMTSSPNADEFQECYEFLDNKADTLLAADEAKLLENL